MSSRKEKENERGREKERLPMTEQESKIKKQYKQVPLVPFSPFFLKVDCQFRLFAASSLSTFS